MLRHRRSSVSFGLACALIGSTAIWGRADVLYVGVSSKISGGIDQVLPDQTVKSFASGITLPTGLALTPSGDLYVADEGQHVIDRLSPDGHVSTFVPFGKFGDPQDIAFDASGNLFVADPYTG